MILLTFAVLFGGVHGASWSHAHMDGDDHALVLVHGDEHADDHDGSVVQVAGEEESSDNTDVKGDVIGQHSHPVGIAAAAVAHNLARNMRDIIPAGSPTRMLTSFSQAPPTQPPSA